MSPFLPTLILASEDCSVVPSARLLLLEYYTSYLIGGSAQMFIRFSVIALADSVFFSAWFGQSYTPQLTRFLLALRSSLELGN